MDLMGGDRGDEIKTKLGRWVKSNGRLGLVVIGKKKGVVEWFDAVARKALVDEHRLEIQRLKRRVNGTDEVVNLGYGLDGGEKEYFSLVD